MDNLQEMVEIFPGYLLSSNGKVFSVSSNWRGYGVREMSQKENSDGYMRVRITVDGKRKALFVHKLIAKFFVGPNPGGMILRHLDDNKPNNDYRNIAWGTRSDNALDRVRNGRVPKTYKRHINAGGQNDKQS